MKPYEKYKDSGVEWIGAVPEHWEVKRLKRIAKICNGQDHKHVWDENGDYPIIGTGGEFGRANQFLFNKPSVILGRKGTIDKPQFIETPFWSVDTAYYTDIYPENDPKYFFYLCLTINFSQYKYGSAVPSMTQETLNQIPFAIPQKSEQTAIARYLDQKTGEIDQLIAQKERLLALWEEEKTALINQAVTRGLDAGAKMKDSGVAWLGEVPEHWEVKRLKYVGEINPTKDFDFEYDAETLCTFLPMEKVSEEGEIDCSIKKPVSELVSGFTFFKKNDVIVAKITPCFENGKGAILEKLDTDFGFGSTEFHVIRPKNDILGKFLYFLTKSEIFMNTGEAMMIGSAGQKRVPTDFIRNFPVGLPELPEQTAIVRHIETQTARIQTQMDQTRKLIELLREYRATLISEVVTGKVKITA